MIFPDEPCSSFIDVTIGDQKHWMRCHTLSLLLTLWTLSQSPIRFQPPLSKPKIILQIASLFLLSTSLANSLRGINPLPVIPRARPIAMESYLWLNRVNTDRNFHHHWHLQRSSLLHPSHLVPFLLDRKLILMVRGLEFHRPQRSLLYNDHHLRVHMVPLPDSYGMKTAVFAFHLMMTTLLNYLHSTHLD